MPWRILYRVLPRAFCFTVILGCSACTDKSDPLPKNRILAAPAVCEIAVGEQTCSIEVSWRAEKSNTCLYRQSTKASLGCGKSGRLLLTDIGLKQDKLQLHAADVRGQNTGTAPLASSRIIGIRNLQPAQTTLQDLRPELFERTVYSFVASTWDGRLYFSQHQHKSEENALWSVHVMRPEWLKGQQLHEISFSHPKLFSDGHLVDSDQLTTKEVSSLRQRLYPMGGLDRLGKNEAKIQARMHLAVYPHPGIANNPYRSGPNGAMLSDGDHLTYRLFMIGTPREVEGIRVPHPERDQNILAQGEAMIVVENPYSKNARVANVKILQPMRALRDKEGNLFTGYEPTVSLDGRLIVWHGSPNKNHLDGFLRYTWRDNAFQTGKLAPARDLSAMHWVDGPGNDRGETVVAGKKFSHRFPLARYPLRDDKGNTFTRDQPFMGAYPWLSFDGADLIASVVASPSTVKRRGTVIMGARTLGKIQYVDGAANPIRGNVTGNYKQLLHEKPYIDLALKYETMRLKNYRGKQLGWQGYWNILFSVVGQYGTSWSALHTIDDVPLPQHPARQSYGLLSSSSRRYFEVPVIDDLADVILYWPMNESLRFDFDKIKQAAQHKFGTYHFAGELVQLDAAHVGDYSRFNHTGRLGGALFPFEYFGAKQAWQKKRTVIDQSYGAIGNSVAFPGAASVVTDIQQEALNILQKKQKLSVGFWFRTDTSQPLTLLNLGDLLQVRKKQQWLQIRWQGKWLQPVMISNPKNKADDWQTLMLVYNLGTLQLYLNGRSVNRFTGLEKISFSGPLTYFELGAANNRHSGSFFIDEVIVRASALNHGEAARFAWLQPRTVPAQNNDQRRENIGAIRKLGAVLFHSNKLSSTQTISCASCHKADNAFADTRRFSVGVAGKTSRNTPAMLHLPENEVLFWDGRAPSLATQVLHPIFDSIEMNMNADQLVDRLASDAFIDELFQKAYGLPPSMTLVADALSSFVRLLPNQRQKMQFLQNLSPLAFRGWEIFSHKANCIACHRPPHFTDDQFHHNTLAATTADTGRGAVTDRDSDQYRFKTPSLLGVAETAPYFHDGRAKSLDAVIEFYASGGRHSARQPSAASTSSGIQAQSHSLHIRPLDLSKSDKKALKAFLRSL